MTEVLPKFCILLTSYNGMKYIDEQINSILNQKKIILDIHISDDISDDGTKQYLLGKINKHKNIFLLKDKIKFNIASKNFYRLIKDVEIVNYDFIALSDQDDVWDEFKLYEGYKKLIEKKMHCYSSSVKAFWKDGKKEILSTSLNQKNYDYFFESAGPGCTYIIEQKHFQEMKSFFLDNWKAVNQIDVHDWLIYAFMRTRKKKWLIDSNSYINYRQHENNQLGANSNLFGTIKRLKILKNGWGKKHLNSLTTLLKTKENKKFVESYQLGKWPFLYFYILKFGQFRRKLSANFFLFFIILFNLY
jgi:rhamnosyltransferase